METSHDSETPADGQQVITACAFIHNEFDGVTKVFLPKRADTKKFIPGLFELPGGHIDFGEDLVKGLKREIKEEFDMNISVGDPFGAFTYENLVKKSHSAEVIFFAKFTEPLERIKLNPEDHSSYEWLSRQDVLNRKDEVIAEDTLTYTQEIDPEYTAILKGFEILEGGKLNLG